GVGQGQHSVPSFGTLPFSRYASIALSMQALPRWYAVWPSPSRLRSTPESSWSARATACSYGVAGSRVVPTTRIGAAPLPSIFGGSGVRRRLDERHGRLCRGLIGDDTTRRTREVQVGELQQLLAVAVGCGREGLCQRRPRALVVERQHAAVERERFCQRPILVAAVEWLLVRLVQEVADLLHARLDIAFERARTRAVYAVLHVRLERGVEALRLRERRLMRGQAR